MKETLRASNGHILTNGKIFGRVIYLAEGVDSSTFYEITEEEYNVMTGRKTEQSNNE